MRQLAVMSCACPLITHLQLFTREGTESVIEEMSLIFEPSHVVVGLQLLEMSSITTTNQTISNAHGKFSKFFFRKNITDNVKNSVW